MVFLRGTESHGHLLEFSSWLGHEKGLVTITTLLPGDIKENIKSGSTAEAQKKAFELHTLPGSVR